MSTEEKPIIRRLAKAIGDATTGLVGWAVICAALLGLRFRKFWDLVGRTWQGVLYGYLAFYFGSMVIVFLFTNLERIQSKHLRFVAQMIMCLILAVAVSGVIVLIAL